MLILNKRLFNKIQKTINGSQYKNMRVGVMLRNKHFKLMFLYIYSDNTKTKGKMFNLCKKVAEINSTSLKDIAKYQPKNKSKNVLYYFIHFYLFKDIREQKCDVNFVKSEILFMIATLIIHKMKTNYYIIDCCKYPIDVIDDIKKFSQWGLLYTERVILNILEYHDNSYFNRKNIDKTMQTIQWLFENNNKIKYNQKMLEISINRNLPLRIINHFIQHNIEVNQSMIDSIMLRYIDPRYSMTYKECKEYVVHLIILLINNCKNFVYNNNHILKLTVIDNQQIVELFVDRMNIDNLYIFLQLIINKNYLNGVIFSKSNIESFGADFVEKIIDIAIDCENHIILEYILNNIPNNFDVRSAISIANDDNKLERLEFLAKFRRTCQNVGNKRQNLVK